MQDARSDAGLWLFWPDYSGENPFQHMVHRSFPAGWEVRPGGLDAALAALDAAHGTVVFHLHWEDAIYRDAADSAEAEALVDGFLGGLDAFMARGGRLLWTVHNDGPHEPRFLAVDGRLRRALAARAHAVHMHSRVAAEQMAPPLGLSPEEVLVTPLGGFSGHYPDDASRDSARRYFGIGPEAPVFVTLGAARAYKGLDLLLRAFGGVRDRRPDARLIVAGRTGLPAGAGARFVEPAPGVLLMPNYIDDATVQYVLRAADFAVFSFRRVMVSSSVLLAETFGLPVIVPGLPTLREMVEPGRNGFVYPPGDAEALARLMLGAAALPPESRDALAAGASDDIRRRDWNRYTAALVDAACGAADGEAQAAMRAGSRLAYTSPEFADAGSAEIHPANASAPTGAA
jgi:glycosyltransferase involved in cell wall biosynthesis